MRRSLLPVGIVLLLARPAIAGLLDSPPPRLESTEPLRIVFRMGAIYYESGRVDTLITCVNEDRTAQQIAIELFDANDAPVGSLAWKLVPPGKEVSFVTSPGLVADGRVVIPSLPTINHGKARISSTTTAISCSGSWRSKRADGTTKDSALQLVKKVATGPKP